MESNNVHYKVCDEITYLLLCLNGAKPLSEPNTDILSIGPQRTYFNEILF